MFAFYDDMTMKLIFFNTLVKNLFSNKAYIKRFAHSSCHKKSPKMELIFIPQLSDISIPYPLSN